MCTLYLVCKRALNSFFSFPLFLSNIGDVFNLNMAKLSEDFSTCAEVIPNICLKSHNMQHCEKKLIQGHSDDNKDIAS